MENKDSYTPEEVREHTESALRLQEVALKLISLNNINYLESQHSIKEMYERTLQYSNIIYALEKSLKNYEQTTPKNLQSTLTTNHIETLKRTINQIKSVSKYIIGRIESLPKINTKDISTKLGEDSQHITIPPIQLIIDKEQP